MQAILQLTELPEMSADPQEAADLEQLRSTPFESEQVVYWAVQNGEDVATRQALPGWLSGPIGKSVCRWVDERNTWMDKIDARMAEGKNLPPKSQKSYEQWLRDRSSCNLLFSKTKKAQVISINSHQQLSKMKPDLFSVHLTFAADPSDLVVKASNGDAQRLVLLKGAPAEEGPLPVFLDQQVSQDDIDQAVGMPEADEWDEGDEGDQGHDQERDEISGVVDEEAALVEEDLLQCDEILAATSEEEMIQELAPTVVRVKSFMHRPAFCRLAAQGLTDLPGSVKGIFVSCHATTQTWQGFYPGGGQSGLSRTWGHTTNRTEAEALLAVIKRLLELYTEQFPRDSLWMRQLQLVQRAEATICNL